MVYFLPHFQKEETVFLEESLFLTEQGDQELT